MNTVFGIINLVLAFILVMDKDWWFLFNFTIAFFCLMANYLHINQKPEINDRRE